MEALLALYALGGVVIAGLSVPLVLHRMPPGKLYGIRIHAGMDEPQRWYHMNAHLGRRFLLVGLGTALGSIIFYFTSRPDVRQYALSCLGLLVGLTLWAGISSFLYIRSLRQR
jgi:hypothetical protein